MREDEGGMGWGERQRERAYGRARERGREGDQTPGERGRDRGAESRLTRRDEMVGGGGGGGGAKTFYFSINYQINQPKTASRDLCTEHKTDPLFFFFRLYRLPTPSAPPPPHPPNTPLGFSVPASTSSETVRRK